MSNITTGILLAQDAEEVRVGLRIYFTALLLLVSYLGSRISSLQPLLSLRRHGRVPVMHLTGWLSAFDAARTMWVSRSNPLGVMGLLMLVAGSLLTITDLAVSGLVVTREVPARCAFFGQALAAGNGVTGAGEGGGGILGDEGGDDFLVFPPQNTSVFPHFPDQNNYISLMVKDASATSKRNGGMRGIYTKVRNQAPKFAAQKEDVYGSWRCGRITTTAATADKDIEAVSRDNNRVYPATVDPIALVADLVDNGLAFSLNRTGEAVPGTPVYTATLFQDPVRNKTFFSNMVVLSTNAREVWVPAPRQSERRTPTNAWEIRVSVENGETIGMRSPKSMATYGCKLDAPQASWALQFTFASVLMNFWRTEVFAQVYRGVPSMEFNEGTKLVANVEETLEDVFNNMVMTTGMLEKRGRETVEDQAQGCLVDKAWIPWPVVFLFVVAAGLLFGLAGYAGWLTWKVARGRDGVFLLGRREGGVEGGESPGTEIGGFGPRQRSEIPYVPVGFLSWMKHAVKRQEVMTATIETKDRQQVERQQYSQPNSVTPVNINSRSLKHFDFALDDEKAGRQAVIFVPRDSSTTTRLTGEKRAMTFDVRKHLRGGGRGTAASSFMTPTARTTIGAGTTEKPRRKLRKANTVYGDSSSNTTITTKSMPPSILTGIPVTSLAGGTAHGDGDGNVAVEKANFITTPSKTLSAETLVSPLLLQSPCSIDTQHWPNPEVEVVAWAGGLRRELERVASRDRLVPVQGRREPSEGGDGERRAIGTGTETRIPENERGDWPVA